MAPLYKEYIKGVYTVFVVEYTVSKGVHVSYYSHSQCNNYNLVYSIMNDEK